MHILISLKSDRNIHMHPAPCLIDGHSSAEEQHYTAIFGLKHQPYSIMTCTALSSNFDALRF